MKEKSTILIVDDSELNRTVLADILGDEYNFIEAENGARAIELLRTHTDIDLILLDMVMPEMNGFDVLAMMKKCHWIDDIPVIMISAENASSFVERAYDLGASDYISRPFDCMVVRRRVVNALILAAKQKRLMRLAAEQIYEKGVIPYSDVFTAEEFRKTFGDVKHIFTGVDYIDYYEKTGNCKVILANDPCEILKHTKYVINADIHTRKRTKERLLRSGAEKVVSLDEILTAPVDGSGYNADYGVLGSNLATENSVKLFPRDGQAFVDALQAEMKKRTGKHVECMVYGDGAFKDPVGKIWELADPVVSPGYTKGLVGTPNELKLKYLADNDFGDLKGEALKAAIEERIREKTDESLVGNMVSEGTTPRRLTDLIGSLCDLTSGSGDKGTPIILVQGYFNNYAD